MSFANIAAGRMLSLTTISVKAEFPAIVSKIVTGPLMDARVKRREAGAKFTGAKPAKRVGVKRAGVKRADERDLPGAPVAITPEQADRLELGKLNGHLGYFLRRLQIAVFKDFIRTLAPMDVRPAQYSVLLLIEANPGRSQAAIGQALDIERARLARLLHVLEGRGWIERRAADGDGRSHSLFLTRDGEKALVRIRNLAAQHEAWLVERLGSKRHRTLMDLLQEFG
jgi:DNA-binding MarR family transcriptional regulator